MSDVPFEPLSLGSDVFLNYFAALSDDEVSPGFTCLLDSPHPFYSYPSSFSPTTKIRRLSLENTKRKQQRKGSEFYAFQHRAEMEASAFASAFLSDGGLGFISFFLATFFSSTNYYLSVCSVDAQTLLDQWSPQHAPSISSVANGAGGFYPPENSHESASSSSSSNSSGRGDGAPLHLRLRRQFQQQLHRILAVVRSSLGARAGPVLWEVHARPVPLVYTTISFIPTL
jgi:hypothetical protein